MKRWALRLFSLFLCVFLISSVSPAAGAAAFPPDHFPLLPSRPASGLPADPFPARPSYQTPLRPADPFPSWTARPVTAPEPVPEPEPAEKPASNSETNPETHPETNPETTPETNPKTNPETNPETDPKTDPVTDPETDPPVEPPEPLPPIQVQVFSAIKGNEDVFLSVIEKSCKACESHFGRQIIVTLHSKGADIQELSTISVENTKLLIIMCPKQRLISHVESLRKYMQNGGCIWLCGENEKNYETENGYIRELSEGLGVTYSLEKASVESDSAVLLPGSPLGKGNHFGNYRTVTLGLANSITYKAPAVPVITFKGAAYMIDAPVEQGFLTVSADVNLLSYNTRELPWGAQILHNMLDRSCTLIEEIKGGYTPPVKKVLPYNGEAQELITPGTVTDGIMEYSLDKTDWKTEIPTGVNAGKYTVFYKITWDDSNHKDIGVNQVESEITRIDPKYEAPAARDLYYKGEPQMLITSGTVAVDPAASEAQGTMEYSVDETHWKTTIDEDFQEENCGEYPVYWRIIGADPNYNNIDSHTINVKIKKIDPTYTPPTGQDLSYTGKDQMLSIAGSVSGGVIYYSLDKKTWSTSLPTGLEAGSYTIYWKIEGDDNHNDIVGSYVESTITAQPKPEPKPEPRPEPRPSEPDSGPRYPVVVEDKTPPGGSIRTNLNFAAERDMVYITAVPSAGYQLQTLTAMDKRGKSLEIKEFGRNRYGFKMSNCEVTVSGAFSKSAPGWNQGFSLCTQGNSCPIARFSDAAPNGWYHDGLHFCLENGLLSGYGDGSLQPNAPISRAAFLSILWRLDGRPAVDGLLPFTDVAQGDWCAEAVRWALSEKIASGYGDGRFRPGAPLTREQLAVMLRRYAEHKGLAADQSADMTAFADGGSVSGYAVPAVSWACGAGLLSGQSGENGVRRLNPQARASRAQCAAVITRFLTALAD